MDTHDNPSGDLTELEQRLSSWQPAAEELDRDAMLFAAGRAYARPTWLSRAGWPSFAGCMTVIALALGIQLAGERAERLALAERLRQPPPAPSAPVVVPDSPALLAEKLSPDSYLASHRVLENGFEAWLNRDATLTIGGPTTGPVLQVWHGRSSREP